LENRGNFRYKPFRFTQANQGGWICWDTGGIDQDGGADWILYGLAFEGPGDTNARIEKWVINGIPFIYLENKTR